MKNEQIRSCGVLMHITSLPSPYGIGTFGRDAESFVDWLKQGGQRYWQVLPLVPVGYGNSPYQSYSTFAGNPLLIDLDDLVQDGLLTRELCLNADFGADPSFVDFEKVIRTKIPLLRMAFESFEEDVPYLAFVQEQAPWLDGYSLFMALKTFYNDKPWYEWDENIKMRKPEAIDEYKEKLIDEIKFWKFVQYVFYKQWAQLKRYANKNEIEIIGDIPIYVAFDSADVWENPELFVLDRLNMPIKVAGVPPDYFSKTGQLWGNPIYDWDEMKKENYTWWIRRLEQSKVLYDLIRIDHFRAFDTYYAIPAGAKTAENGKWENGPGIEFFEAVHSSIPDIRIIAEDLGEIFDSVRKLLFQTGYPGMKVLQFGFNANNLDNEHLPHNYKSNCVVYTGTHDNATFSEWYKSADKNTRAMAKRYLSAGLWDYEWSAIKALYASHANTVIIPLQDIVGGDSKRMNTPSTVGNHNWIWRVKKGVYTDSQAYKLKALAQTYFR